MKNFNQKIKRSRNKKGFTLVEIIVVLVILAVLAAAAVPTMLGFVEEAKGKSEIANARAAYVAAQSIVTEEYAKGGTKTETTALSATAGYKIKASDATDATKIDKMLGKDIKDATIRITDNATADGKIDKFEYLNNGYIVTITPGTDAVVAKGTSLPSASTPTTPTNP